MNYDSIIYNQAIKSGYPDRVARIIVAQARFESNDYKSAVLANNNNSFGMKYVGQKLATRGTPAPAAEQSKSCRSGGKCNNSDYYAKYASVADSAKDVLERLYMINMGGVTPQDIKNSTDTLDFANKLKKRQYFGANYPASDYAAGLNSKMKKIDIKAIAKTGGSILLIGGIALLAYLLIKKK